MRASLLACALFLGGAVAPAAVAELRNVPTQANRAVDIESLLVPDTQNIFCFYSAGNSICRGIYNDLTRLGADPKLVLHLLEVPNAQSATAKKYSVSSVPYFIIYDKRGERVSEGPAAYRTVTEMMKKAR